MERQIKLLNKFYDKLKSTSTKSSIIGLKKIWEKYKNYFDLSNDDIKNLSDNIDEYIINKINENYDIENTKNKNELFEYIGNRLVFYIDNIDSNNIENINKFLNWIYQKSELYDLSIFRDKLYELVSKIHQLDHNNDYFTIFNKMNLNKNDSNVFVDGFFNKKLRNCSLLKDYECNEECYLSTSWLDFFKKSKCNYRNIKDILHNTYCSKNSYKSKEELILIIKSFCVEDVSSFENIKNGYSNKINYEGKRIDLSKLESSTLCELFTDILNKYVIDEFQNEKEQIAFWENNLWSKNDLEQAKFIILDSYNNNLTRMQGIKRLYNWILSKKYFIAGSIMIFVFALLMFMNPFGNKDYVIKKVETKITVDSDVNKEELESFVSKYNLDYDMIAGEDKHITIEEYKSCKDLIEYMLNMDIRNNNICDVNESYCSNVIIKLRDVPIISLFSKEMVINQLDILQEKQKNLKYKSEEYDSLQIQIDNLMKQFRFLKAVKYEEKNLSITKSILDGMDSKITQMEASEIKSFYGRIKMGKNEVDVSTYSLEKPIEYVMRFLQGIGNEVFSNTIHVYKDTDSNGNTVFYPINNFDTHLSALLYNPNMKLNVIVHSDPELSGKPNSIIDFFSKFEESGIYLSDYYHDNTINFE